jgi:hypothetical protein
MSKAKYGFNASVAAIQADLPDIVNSINFGQPLLGQINTIPICSWNDVRTNWIAVTLENQPYYDGYPCNATKS